MAQYGDVEIEAPSWPGYAFTVVGRARSEGIRIHRRTFEIHGSREWFGNWCWNRYFMRRDVAKQLLLHLRTNGWRVTCGPSRIYYWWNGVEER